jgi:scyllo-inositol 2-dehydrogenase (NADP+)
MKTKINVGLIGYGMGGKLFHAPILTSVSGLNLIKIRETKSPNIKDALQKYPQAKIVANSGDIFEDKLIDLVVITSPNHTHFPLAKEALKAGKNVVVDKPFTVSSQEADELIELANAKNKLLSVYQNRRFDSEFKTVKKILDSKILGNLVEYEVHFDRFRNFIKPDTWKEEATPGTGILYDLGSHLIDQALFYFGMPETVYADLRIQRKEGKIIDNFEVVLNYNGLKATLKAGMLVREIGPRITLLGDRGTYQSYGMDVQEAHLKAGIFPNEKEDWGVGPEELWGTLNTEINGVHFRGKVPTKKGDYREYYQNIYNVLSGKEKLIVTPVAAKNTILIIEAALKSNQEKRVVEL